MRYCKRNASEFSANFYHIVVLAAIADVVVLVAAVAAVVAELDGSSQAVVGVTEPCVLSSDLLLLLSLSLSLLQLQRWLVSTQAVVGVSELGALSSGLSTHSPHPLWLLTPTLPTIVSYIFLI